MTPIADLIVLPNIPQVRALSNPLPQVGQARRHLKLGNTEYKQIWFGEMKPIWNDHKYIKDIIKKQWLPEYTLSSVSPKSLLAASFKSSLLHTFTGSWWEISYLVFISITCKSQTQINLTWHSILNNSQIKNLKSTSSRLVFNSITTSCLPFFFTPPDWNQTDNEKAEVLSWQQVEEWDKEGRNRGSTWTYMHCTLAYAVYCIHACIHLAFLNIRTKQLGCLLGVP